MKTVDPKDRLEGDWEPSQLPDLRPDAPTPEPSRLHVLPPEAPSLCEQGPCANYHVVVLELDAAKPLDHSDASSKGHRVRTCYPAPGIEMPLDAPVFECNRWTPDLEVSRSKILLRDAYACTEEGRAYTAALDAWRQEQERIKREEEEIALMPVTTSVIEEMIRELEPADSLELRKKGEDIVLAKYIHTDTPGTGIYELALLETFGPGEYTLRHLKPHGDTFAFASIRNLTIEPLEKA